MLRLVGNFVLVLGLLLIAVAILLPVMQWIPVGLSVAIGVPGIVLIALGFSFRSLQTSSHPAPEILQTLYSADRKFRATVRQRSDSHYQVEYWALVNNQTEHGLEQQYIRQGGSTIADSLASAVDLATDRLRSSG